MIANVILNKEMRAALRGKEKKRKEKKVCEIAKHLFEAREHSQRTSRT